MKVTKRDGSIEEFNSKKIENAILQAFSKEKSVNRQTIKKLVSNIEKECYDLISIEEIQNQVETQLMKTHPNVAKRYITYREKHRSNRINRTFIETQLEGIINIDEADFTKENANINAHTPAGQMMQIASIHSKDYAMNHLLSKEYAALHKEGYIHIHDLDYYPSKTTTCVQYDLNELYKNGFYTINGKINEPNSIETYATLATIVFQTNQNEQHGGQAIPAFDFFMAPGVLKSFKKNLFYILHVNFNVEKSDVESAVTTIDKIDYKKLKELCNEDVEKYVKIAHEKTEIDTYQAMQGFIFNLNTMHSRGGNQVVFSSINYGTDTSSEGRMVIKSILKATSDGLGNKEVPIFPIQIFKVKEGINYNRHDIKNSYNVYEWDVEYLNSEFQAPNFDLLIQAIKTSATSLFPNFVFLDAPFNHHKDWNKYDPKRYQYEVATMGCRTRVFENLHGEKTSIGRGNVSFTTINIVRLAIEAANATKDIEKRKQLFKASALEMVDIVAKQLMERMHFQQTALKSQFPFMSRNNIWKGLNESTSNTVDTSIKTGTLAIGFIGGHNAMQALFNKSHSDDQEVYDYLYSVIEEMSKRVLDLKQKYNLNFSLIATPAEGLSGRFTKLDKSKFGEIKDVNDREYYVNSFHVDVKANINAFEKIKMEAPFHALTLGGHITYIELDGESKKNPQSLLKIVECMYRNNIGYGSINHPIDQCRDCNYSGTIYYSCPNCNSHNIRRIRRITGYLTGDLSSWNGAKQAEEKDRIKHL